MTLTEQILIAAKERGVMIATAESCTGGMVAAALTDLPGSSAVFERGFVTYSNSAKMQMLLVSPEAIAKFGAVSEATAIDMAYGAINHSKADIAVAITGVAGPGGTDRKPEGMVCFAVCGRHLKKRVQVVQFGPLGRDRVRIAARDHALQMLLDAVRDVTPEASSPNLTA